MRRHALFILGMHRSGATALAGALAKAGIGLPRTPRPAQGRDGPTYESVPLVALDDALLEALGSRWDDAAALPDRWSERDDVRGMQAPARAAVRQEFGHAAAVVVKDARMSRLAPFWREAFEAEGFAVSVALMLRRPREVAHSLGRDGMPRANALSLWLSHLVAAERGTRDLPRILVGYDKLLDAPAGTLAHVVAASRLPVELKGTVREAALAAIDPDLSHAGRDAGNGSTTAPSTPLERVLDEGYEQLARLLPGADLASAVEALAASAWAAEPDAADAPGADDDALRAAQRRIAELEDALAQAARGDEGASTAQATRAAESGTATSTPARLASRGHRSDAIGASRLAARSGTDDGTQPSVPENTQSAELAQALRDLDDERETIGRLTGEIESMWREAQGRQQALDAAHAALAALTAELERERADAATFESREAVRQDETIALHAEAAALQSERDRALAGRDDAMRERAAAEAALRSLRDDVEAVARARDAAAREAAEAAEALVALRSEFAGAEASLRESAEERAKLRAELRAAEGRSQALERELAQRAADNAALSERCDALERTLADVERRWIGRVALNRTRRR